MAKTLTIEAAQKGTTAVIKVSGRIHKWMDANSRAFEQQVEALIASGCNDLKVIINSEGGDPIEANQMGITLMKFPGTKEFQLESIAASAATVFLHLFDKGSCYENSLAMLHKPKGMFEGNADQIEASAKLIRIIEDNMVKGYAAKMGKTIAEVAEMIKTDYWMDAKEMLKLGIVSNIIKGKTTPLTKADAEDVVQMYSTVPSSIAALATSTPAQNSNTDMSKLILLAAALGMTGDAATNEEQIILKATEALTAKAALDKIIADQKVEIEALKNAEKTKALATATEAIATALKDNKITAAQKVDFEEQAKVNPEFVVKILASMTPHVAITAQLNAGIVAAVGRDAWTWEDWSTKDSKGLGEMKAQNFDQYSALFEAKFGTKPRKA